LQDSAQEGCSVTYGAYPGEEPVFSSGVKIGGWRELGRNRPDALSEKAKAKVWVADVPEMLGRFYTLYDGDRRLPRACSAGFAPTLPPLDYATRRKLWQAGNLEALYSLSYPKGALKNWSNLEDVEIVIRPSQPHSMNILALESVDEAACVARTSIPGYHPLRQLRVWPPWRGTGVERESLWVENVLEALDTPGEWVLNTQERKLYLWPTGEEPGDGILAPCLRELIRVEGDVEVEGPTDIPVRGLVFKDLTFTQGDRGVWTKDDAGIQHDWEMVDKDAALVRLRGAEECAIQDCKFFNSSGASAVRLDLYCQRNRVVGNEINHLGGAGILLIGYGPGTKDVNKHNEVLNNHIHHCGEIWWHSQMIVLSQSGENQVAHNCIHHVPRKAICLCGVRPQFFNRERPISRECARMIRWDEIGDLGEWPESTIPLGGGLLSIWDKVIPFLHTRNNVVEYSEVYRTDEVLGDGSAINMSGAGRGNIIRRNYGHHILNPNIHGAIRTDDYQKGTLIEENVIFRTNSEAGLCLRHENYTVNNVVVDIRSARPMSSGPGIPSDYVWVGQMPFDGSRIVKNIFFHPGGEQGFYIGGARDGSGPFEHLGKMESGEVDRNVYFAANAPQGDDVIVELRKVGHEKNGAYTDPLFVDWENGDFRLKPDSPALKMGIKSIDLSNVGLTEDFPERFK